MRLLGITMGFNEADCIGHAVRCLVRSGHAVTVFDHGSKDGTGEVAKEAADEEGAKAKVIRVDRGKVPFLRIFPHICRHIREQIPHYDWVTWLAADEILRPPEDCDLEKKHLVRAWRRGYQVIRPFLREFWLTEADPSIEDEPDHTKRLIYYRPRGKPGPNCPRGWAIHLTGTMPHGLHRRTQDWPRGTKINQETWWLDHYPIRTVEQGKRKIMRERPPRTHHYRKHRAEACANLIRRSENLSCRGLS